MNHYSQSQLDEKIYSFMDKKIDKFPELAHERHYIEYVPATRANRTSRGQLFSFFRTSPQY